MADLREQLQQCFQGNVCLMGLGNADYGDDGLGVHLAEAVAQRFSRAGGLPGNLGVIIAGTTPENFIGVAQDRGFDHLVFLDAVEFGGTPGSVVLLDCGQIEARYPQISTHKLSLGLLAKCIEASGTTKAWLLGVQPESLKAAQTLTPAVRKTLEVLDNVFYSIWNVRTAENPCSVICPPSSVIRPLSVSEVDLC